MKQYTQGIDPIGLIINGYILIFFPSLSFDGIFLVATFAAVRA